MEEDEMNKLFMRMTGLCSFVPNLVPDQVRVVLVDASVPHGPHGKPHNPRLIFQESAWQSVPGGRQPDEFFADPDGNKMAMCDLSGQELFINGAGANSLQIEGWGAPVGECPAEDGSDRLTFSWVGPMQLINNGQGPSDPVWGEIRSGCLDDKNVPKEVTARIRLTEGTLMNHEFSRDDAGAIVKWQFVNPTGGSPLRQALSEELMLTFDFTPNFVEFAFIHDIHGPSPSLGPMLRLGVAAKRVNAWVANMPLDEIRNRRYFGDPRPGSGHRDPDHHFIHFYDLVKGGPKDKIPHPLPMRCLWSGLPSVDNPKCPPVQLNPATSA